MLCSWANLLTLAVPLHTWFVVNVFCAGVGGEGMLAWGPRDGLASHSEVKRNELVSYWDPVGRACFFKFLLECNKESEVCLRFLFSENGQFMSVLGEVFSTEQWWSVDLLAICKVHLVRVVTDVNYKPDELKKLTIRVGEMTTSETTLNFISSV